jgi:hypothetical protein
LKNSPWLLAMQGLESEAAHGRRHAARHERFVKNRVLQQGQLLNISFQVIQASDLLHEVSLTAVARVPDLDGLSDSRHPGCRLRCIVPDGDKTTWSQHHDQLCQELFANSPLVWFMGPIAKWVTGFMGMERKDIPEKHRRGNQCKHTPDDRRRPFRNH